MFLALWSSLVLAATPVAIDLDATRRVLAAVPDGWAAAPGPARCWSRPADRAANGAAGGAPLRACITTLDAGGRGARELLAAQQATVQTVSCEEARGGGQGAVSGAMQSCRIKARPIDQVATWQIVSDGVQAAVLTVTSDNPSPGEAADIHALIASFRLMSPLAAITRDAPVCGALQTALAANADGFEADKGAPVGDGFATALRWPDATAVVLLPGATGLGLHATLLQTPDTAAAYTKLQATLQGLGKCDTWCTPMRTQEAVVTPPRREILFLPRDPTASAPRCAKGQVRVMLATDAAGTTEVAVRVEPLGP